MSKKQTDWVGGIDIFPGIRIIPDSPQYHVTDWMLDAVVFLESGQSIRCSMVSKIPREVQHLIHWPALWDKFRQTVALRYGLYISQVATHPKYRFVAGMKQDDHHAFMPTLMSLSSLRSAPSGRFYMATSFPGTGTGRATRA